MATQPTAAGWQSDPWGKAPWRWWDGHAWTGHTHGDAHVSAPLFQDSPTVSTVLYLIAGRLLPESHSRWGDTTRTFCGGPDVVDGSLWLLVYGSALWSLREQGLIWLGAGTDDSKFRRKPRVYAKLLGAAERPALEGAIIGELATATEPVTVRKLIRAVAKRPSDEVKVPKGERRRPARMTWTADREGLELGYLSRPEKRGLGKGSHEQFEGNCDAIATLEPRAGELAEAWQGFVDSEPELIAAFTPDVMRAIVRAHPPG
jgi:hypothetical protein